MKVLLVDDSDVGQFVISNLLRRSGHQIDVASDGVHAWELLRGGGYDIVLSDILMPRLDGFELCYLVKSQPLTRDIPFVFFSAEYLSPQDQAFAQKLGAARYIFMTEDPVQFVGDLEATLHLPREQFPSPPDLSVLNERDYLKGYKDRLFHQLHEKIGQLEETTVQWLEERQAVQQLRELDRLKDNFIAMLSHELRNPLTTIMGYCDILRDGLQGPVEEEQRKSLGIIYDRSQHVLGMINRLLDFVRLRSRNLPVQLETVAVAEEMERILTTLAAQATAKGVTLVDGIPAETPAVLADRQLLHQVMIILLDNAIKFTPAGGKITISAGTDGDNVRLAVRDTGPGITPADLAIIFEPFHQGAASSGRQGIGLGLAIARQLMTTMGGRIEVESSFNTGSNFFLLLPRPNVG